MRYSERTLCVLCQNTQRSKDLHLELSLGENYCVKLVMGLNFHSANGHKNYHDNFDGIFSVKVNLKI